MRAVRTICQDVAKSVGRDINLGAVRLALLMWADFLWSQTVINAFNVASWRGVWGLWEALFDYFFEVTTYSPKAKSLIQIFQGWPEYQKCTITFGTAFILTLAIYFVSPVVDMVLKDLSQTYRFIFSRLYTIIAFIIQMLLWYSSWNFLQLVEADWRFNPNIFYAVCFLLPTIVFVCLRCFNTLNGVPASVERDWNQENYCTVSTLFQV